MTTIAWIAPHEPLPDSSNATPEGLVAASWDLSATRLAEAYRKGMFPWFNEGDPVLWWSPDPRMVLHCDDFKVSHSLAKKIRQLERAEMLPGATLTIRVDTAFSAVMDACSAPRRGQPGTWISPQIKHAYDEWHHLGAAHSVETWQNGRLVGGLYGVSLGGMFFGESMFARVPDASKLALAWLVQFLKRHGVNNIDCQQETPHLATLGARPVPRAEFIQRVERAQRLPEPPWNKGQLLYNGTFAPGIRVQP